MALVRDLSTAQLAFQIEGGEVDRFSVIRYRGSEGLCQLYRFEIELASSDEQVAFDDIVGRAAVLSVNADTGTRWFHGIISRFEMTGETTEQNYYRVELVPGVWLLTHRYNCRIFQEKKVTEIIADILEKAGIPSDRYDLSGITRDPEPREYCVQYRETDYNFICRLMEEEGIWWYFQQTQDGHKFIAADAPSAYAPIEGESAELPYHPPTGLKVEEEHVFRFRMAQSVRPGKVVLTDFNFEKPGLSLESSSDVGRDAGLEFFDYPGEYTEQAVGTELATLRAEEFEAARTQAVGRSNSSRLSPGRTFDLTEHPSDPLNRSYLLTSVTHEGRESITRTARGTNGRGLKADPTSHRPRTEWLFHGGQVAHDPTIAALALGGNPLEAITIPNLIEDEIPADLEDADLPVYECRFEAVPSEVSYRPPRVTPWPKMRGPQTARVVGPEGEEIYTDEYGRVKVQFNWDREGEFNESSSCWIRVSQGMAGGQYGMMFLPRVGQEVIVDFLEGDPDKPIITGRVYNADHMPPYTLPDEKTKSVVKTNSSTGGGGFNEIRLEDAKGNEQFFIHAQKNYDKRVVADAKEWIGNDKHSIVKKKQFQKVEGDKHATVEGDRKELVKGDLHVTVETDRNEKVGGDVGLDVAGDQAVKVGKAFSLDAAQAIHEKAGMTYGLDAGMDVHIKGGMNVVVEAGLQLTIKAGSSFISIGPAGIAISGQPLVMINSGGAAGSGAGCSPSPPAAPDPPEDPLEADVAEPGKDIPPEGPPSPQAEALAQAALRGTPFCEKCAEAQKKNEPQT